MALIDPIRLLSFCRSRAFAVGFFESWDIASLQGVIDAAEQTDSPIIIGFNGDFLSGESRLAKERIEWYGALGRAAAESARIPCSFIFNECPRDDWVKAAVDSGFNLVMPADPHVEAGAYRTRVKFLTQYAHSKNVRLEAEVGDLPCGATGQVVGGGRLTEVGEAVRFVEETGIDLLAVSIGNVHIKVEGRQPLDLGRLKTLSEAVSIGLVLHGGTGIPSDDIRRAISFGVVKVNYGTYLKQAWLREMRAALAVQEVNPHELLGLGGPEDALVRARTAVRDAVLERIGPLGCSGMASAFELAASKPNP